MDSTMKALVYTLDALHDWSDNSMRDTVQTFPTDVLYGLMTSDIPNRIKFAAKSELDTRRIVELDIQLSHAREDVISLRNQVYKLEMANNDLRKAVEPGFFLPTEDELSIAEGGDKISAIKEYRTRTGSGLKESKDAIEKAMKAIRNAD